MAQAKNAPRTDKKNRTDQKKVADTPIELDDGDFEQVTGGTGAGGNLREDPCAGGRIR